MMILCVICTVALLSPAVIATDLTPCKSGVPVPESVEVSNCNKLPCIVKSGSTLVWSTVFTPDKDYSDVIVDLTSTFRGVSYGYPGVEGKSPCDSMYSMPDHVKVDCPLQKGKTYNHEISIPLKIPLPKVTLPVKYTLKDKTTQKSILCYELVIAVES